MSKIRKSSPSNFTTLTNELINDTSLSFKAKGIYAYLWSKADDWQFYIKEIASKSKDGIDSVRSGIKELEDAGYLERERVNNKDTGLIEYDYIIHESPYREKPHTVNPITDKSNTNNKQPINKEQKNNTPISPNGEDVNLSWRDSFTSYLTLCEKAFLEISEDEDFKSKMEASYPEVIFELSFDKIKRYWATEKAWRAKLKTKTKDINWKNTIANGFSKSMNQVTTSNIGKKKQVFLNGESIWVTVITTLESKYMKLSNCSYNNFTKSFYIASSITNMVYSINFDSLPNESYTSKTISDLSNFIKSVGEM